MQFTEAVRLVSGLEFLGAEDLDEDDLDSNPVVYLMVPSVAALRYIVTLWRGWQRTGAVPPRYSAWKALLSQLRNIRAWGPEDRVTAADHDILVEEYARDAALTRVEVELVFRRKAMRQRPRRAIVFSRWAARSCPARGSTVPAIVRCSMICRDHARRRHQSRPRRTRRSRGGVSNSAAKHLPARHLPKKLTANREATRQHRRRPDSRHHRYSPIVGTSAALRHVRDDDPAMWRPRRRHARPRTAMAGAVIHGEIHAALGRPLEAASILSTCSSPRRTSTSPSGSRTSCLLICSSVLWRDGTGEAPTAQHVLIVNASLGDPNKPFAGRLSGWARVVDHLAATYGILFVVSAGNHHASLETEDMTAGAFGQWTGRGGSSSDARERQAMDDATVLAPGEAMTAITVGALHADQFAYPHSLPAYNFDVFEGSGLCSVSSALGPGHNGATKPEILAPGGRHHVRLSPQGDHHHLQPLTTNAAAFGGIAVAAPPSATSLGSDVVARSIGTSVAAALVTGEAARAHEALEAAFPDLVSFPSAERACLLKALLVHGARWTDARDLLIEVVGPPEARYDVRQKDNVRRYIGYGAYDPNRMISCADDRATAMGGRVRWRQIRESASRIAWPAAMTAKSQAHPVGNPSLVFAAAAGRGRISRSPDEDRRADPARHRRRQDERIRLPLTKRTRGTSSISAGTATRTKRSRPTGFLSSTSSARRTTVSRLPIRAQL